MRNSGRRESRPEFSISVKQQVRQPTDDVGEYNQNVDQHIDGRQVGQGPEYYGADRVFSNHVFQHK